MAFLVKVRESKVHSDLNDQYSFHSTIDTPQGVPEVSTNPDDQTEVYSGQLER